VLNRFGHLLLIFALLSATGAHWAALQSVAWASMLADNARVSSLPEAIEKTFDGKHPCALCKSIAHGRQNEKKSDVQNEAKRLEFLNDAVAIFTSPSTHFYLACETTTRLSSLNRTPPVPPPRSCFVEPACS
jgi:hypothetical protein